MDLRKSPPRSPNAELLGIVSLARTIDKARAFYLRHQGEYHYNCPHDKALFDFLGTDARTFADRVGRSRNDEDVIAWINEHYLHDKTSRDRQAFNNERRAWRPVPGSESERYFRSILERVAPDRSDITTWFELIDLEEGRALPVYA